MRGCAALMLKKKENVYLPRVVNVFKLQRLIKPFRAKDKYLEMVPN
jgi:hypothetical protein